MENNHTSYYCLSVHPSKINVYYESSAGKRLRNFNNDDSETNNTTTTKQPDQFKDNYHNGRISAIAKRKVSKAVDYMVYMAKPKLLPSPFAGKHYKFKVSFVTLTLSSDQVHSDQVIKSELLNQFLIEMVKRWGVKMYIWRAEKQVNGNIHFHIMTDAFIPWNELRNVWNRIQQKLGYVTRYRDNRLLWHKDGFKFDPKHAKKWPWIKQLKAYKVGARTDWENPNSVDIHSLRFIRNINAYIVKYVSKNKDYTDKEKDEYDKLTDEEKERIRQMECISGKLWSCSTNLTNLDGGYAVCDSYIYDELQKVFEHNPKQVYNTDFFHVYTVDIATLVKLKCFAILSCFEDYIRQKFPDDYLPVMI